MVFLLNGIILVVLLFRIFILHLTNFRFKKDLDIILTPSSSNVLSVIVKMIEEFGIKKRAQVKRDRSNRLFGLSLIQSPLPSSPMVSPKAIEKIIVKKDFFGRPIAVPSFISSIETASKLEQSKLSFKYQDKSAHAVRKNISISRLIYRSA